MSLKEKLLSMRAACHNIWHGTAFTFSPGGSPERPDPPLEQGLYNDVVRRPIIRKKIEVTVK